MNKHRKISRKGKTGRSLFLEHLEHRCLMAVDPLFLTTPAAADWSLAADVRYLESEANAVLIADPAPDPLRLSGIEESSTSDIPPFPLGDTFLLHSQPGATKVIYLDFDGHTTSNTLWNDVFNGGASFVTPAYSIDGSSSFSDAERDRIQRIWQRVVEDFLPFDVDVTTEDPGVEALRRTSSNDTEWGIRVAIGGSSSDWYTGGAGGVAYLDSFNWSTDSPTYVFEANLNNGNEKSTAEAISHEIGHTLGLRHDGTSYMG